MSYKKNLIFFGQVGSRSGYGSRARDLVRSIIELDEYNVSIMQVGWGRTPETGLDKEFDTDIISRVMTSNPLVKPDIFVQLDLPRDFKRFGDLNIGVTAGIETNVAPPNWYEGANNMDIILGSSEHSIRVLRETKYVKYAEDGKTILGNLELNPKVKLDTLFEGVNTDIFKTINVNNAGGDLSSRLDSINEKFCFLFVGMWVDGVLGEDRKDVGMLIKTFCETFISNPPSFRPALVLKVNGGNFSYVDNYQIEEKISSILEGFTNPPNVYILHGDLTDEEMNILYNHNKIKAMVTFTKGEGFGRPLLEFSFVGKPLIASSFGGQNDFLHKDYTVKLPGKATKVHPSVVNDWIVKDSEWFTVDYFYASQVLKNVFNNYENFLKLAKGQKKYVENNFTRKLMGERFKKIVDDFYSGKREEKNILTNLNIKLPELKKIKLNKED